MTPRADHGRLSSAWSTADGFSLKVTVPTNTTAEVVVPNAGHRAVTRAACRRCPRRASAYLRMDGDSAVFEVGSGTYDFAVRGKSKAVDHVDIGDATSENAHAITASPTLGPTLRPDSPGATP
ncbi:alpha-L-rhamnosidase C-terminal domain-containing protein [Saccharothrix luteola]|uniref:alpha-L-rhamnosidase C-terminal domain-containing protein n=1 Tax=Saccharothrix luteola TaxID=2893018 RepID=UPI001E51ED9C|nr:alpha-L-rhamnosidase C-terminal domain-containing protein [Saccharothrix luteola]MCC8245067.1 hypothetical protein [Saccharothrix luteola]